MSARRILILTAALAATGGASLAAGPDPEPAGSGSSAGQQPVQSVDADQAASFGVLRRGATAQDRLSSQALEFVRNAMTDVTGAGGDLARRARVTSAGTVVHVIPGRGWICLYASRSGVDGGSGTCNRTSEAMRGFVAGADVPSPGVIRGFGLVPDGVDGVTLRSRDGSAERVDVEGNVYVFETARAPQQVEWRDAVVPVPVP